MSETQPEAGSYRHGTQYAYRRRGCRCDACKGWKAEQSRRYRGEKRLRERKWPSWSDRGRGVTPRRGPDRKPRKPRGEQA